MNLVELLDAVEDWPSFSRFVEVLVADRKDAERLEAEHPQRFGLGGAGGWQNSQISSYLDGALACAEADRDRDSHLQNPSWRHMAEFLYGGKIYE